MNQIVSASPNNGANEADFVHVLHVIRQARQHTLTVVNQHLIELYWQIGKYLSKKIATDGWGKGSVQQLADWLFTKEPGLKGFSAQNLWRMRQFFDTYAHDEKLSPLVRELAWTHNLLLLSKCKHQEEREFYLKTSIEHRWGKRELERQISSGLFERVLLNPLRASETLKALHPQAQAVFKDSYMVDYLNLPAGHSERDLQAGLMLHLKQFLLELGSDFCFVGQEFCVQVGTHDYFIDLLFFHRGLQALVAFELKIDEFKPADLGQLNFYLEALDRDYKKPYENPSIGILLCKTKDADVVEYALSRSLSSALVAEYQTRLPNKALLQAKLEEFYEMERGKEEE
jgi:predicted nuclease of restriction endonuclease-like (RecB) superfamily